MCLTLQCQSYTSSKHVCVCSRCSAALGDMSKARYLRGMIELARRIESETVSEPINIICGL